MAIEPKDVSDAFRDNLDFGGFYGEDTYVDLHDFLNMTLDDPHTRAAMVRELIERGACSPPVWAVETVREGEFVSLHKDEIDAFSTARRLHEIHGGYYCCGHWKGETK